MYPKWRLDAILNIYIISKATFTKIYLYMNYLVRNNITKFHLSIMRLDEIINLKVIHDGGRTPS